MIVIEIDHDTLWAGTDGRDAFFAYCEEKYPMTLRGIKSAYACEGGFALPLRSGEAWDESISKMGYRSRSCRWTYGTSVPTLTYKNVAWTAQEERDFCQAMADYRQCKVTTLDDTFTPQVRHAVLVAEE